MRYNKIIIIVSIIIYNVILKVVFAINCVVINGTMTNNNPPPHINPKIRNVTIALRICLSLA